ncbi:MAG: M28 family peptidase [Anaerolineales bacterium]|nr:M28 family peptidase [Anaerolineales bacterium]
MRYNTETHDQAKAQDYLHYLCTELPNRRTGSAENRAATDFFAATVEQFGFRIERSQFSCIDWNSEGATLEVDGKRTRVHVSPYSAGIDVQAPIIRLASLEELASSELHGRIALLAGELVKEQLMPKNFPFYNPEHHREIIAMLEQKKPAALIAATGKDPQMAGGVYPFPLFEDGDFDIPSVYITDVEGERLAALEGRIASLHIDAARIPSTGFNMIARKGNDKTLRLVFCAHIDAKEGTPGALDNAAGIVTLLLLAERLLDYSGEQAVEIAALNGEDYYAASGEIQYLKSSLGAPGDILLAINIDGAGYKDGRTAYSLYGCSDKLTHQLKTIFSGYPDLVEGPEWYQSDHSLFIQQGIPALAFTSDQFDALWSEIAHTPDDQPHLVSIQKLISLSAALHDIVLNADRFLTEGDR